MKTDQQHLKRPQIERIDHLHVYSQDRDAAQKWYEEILGFVVMKDYSFWADEGGPLVVSSPRGRVELAIFEREEVQPCSIIAFGVDGATFIKWKKYLEQKHLLVACKDHTVTWSLYFNDLDGNGLEITTHDYGHVKEGLETVDIADCRFLYL